MCLIFRIQVSSLRSRSTIYAYVYCINVSNITLYNLNPSLSFCTTASTILILQECPESLNYAEAGTECVHFFISVPLTIHNGPDEYIVRDIMKSNFLKAINLDGTLYDAIKTRNEETSFVGIGKPGAPLLWS